MFTDTTQDENLASVLSNLAENGAAGLSFVAMSQLSEKATQLEEQDSIISKVAPHSQSYL